MPSMVEVKCKRCKQLFMARVADRKRGWGKFCSKSCKASEQESKTGQYYAYLDKKDEDELLTQVSMSEGEVQ